METIFNNKRFIQGATVLMVVLVLFVLALFINTVKENKYIGHGTQPSATITVSGKGEVKAVSDIATLTFTISKDGDTTKQAQDSLNESLTKTLKYIKDQKIADADIKSEYGGINPKYGQQRGIACYTYPCPPQPEPKIVGYTATQSIVVKVRAVDTANEIRTGLANLGITNINGPTFSIDNEDGLMNDARNKAIDDARAKAKVLAEQLDVDLGDIVSFSDSTNPSYPMMYDKAATMSVSSAGAAPELPKGENKITSNVNIVYEIR